MKLITKQSMKRCRIILLFRGPRLRKTIKDVNKYFAIENEQMNE